MMGISNDLTPVPLTQSVLSQPRAESAYSNFSIDDYDKVQGPYQIVMPAYPAPVFLNTYVNMAKALRECGTLCTLRGKPFRLMAWSRTGSGAARGGVPCAQCKKTPNPSRFPRPVCSGCAKKGVGFLEGFPDARPIAEFRPNGQRIVFDANGNGHLVGRPNYIVSHTPFPRLYNNKPIYPQRYLEALRMGVALCTRSNKRLFVCSTDNGKVGIPITYVDPAQRGFSSLDGTVQVNNVSPEYFRELVEESSGGTYLGQGA